MNETDDVKGAEQLEDVAKECMATNQINIGGNTVTRCTEYLPEDQKLLVRWAYQVARDKKMSWQDLERESKISTTTWYRVWTDKYINPNSKQRVSLKSLCEDIERWKKLTEERAHLRGEMFVKTSTWDRIEWICRKALIRRKIGFIYGESHVGKTECLKKFAELNNHGQTTYIELPPAAGVQLMTKTIAKALHVGSGTCYEKLIDDVLEAVDKDRLLIFDEVHRVFTNYQKSSIMRCLDVLRYIHDKTDCGMVLCGTNVFRNELQEGAFKQYLKQLQRRGLYEIQLPDSPPREDLDLIAKEYGLRPATGPVEQKVVQLVAKHGLAAFFTRLDDAVEMASKAHKDVSWELFERALSFVDKMSAVERKKD